MIERSRWLKEISSALKRSRVTALVGPRQSGKTTLARTIVPPDSTAYFDLEDPRSLARLTEPMTALAPLKGKVVIDEVQRRPDIFPVLRVLADRRPLPARFLILGSARRTCSSVRRDPRWENGDYHPEPFRSRGTRPRCVPATLEAWGVSTVLSCPLGKRQLHLAGTVHPDRARARPASTRYQHSCCDPFSLLDHASTLPRQRWNAAEPARSLGLSQPTVRRYLDLLTGLYMVRQLQPWHENLKKRQVKAPKVYLRDSGLLHVLLGIRTGSGDPLSPKSGCLVGGLRHRGGAEVRAPRCFVLLGHPYRR